MKNLSILCGLIASFSVSAFGAEGVDAAKLLREADRSRGGLSAGLGWQLKVEGGGAAPAEYDVKVKGVDVLARCTAPARQKGETLLFNDRTLWVHRAGLRKPASLSPRQRLSGQAANGDIATTNYARDYTATVEGEEKVDGADTYRLLLRAKEKNVTYDQIRYWVTKKTRLGVKAEFLTLEGQPFKRARFAYEHTVDLAGEKVPFVSRMEIEDVANPQARTTLQYGSPKAETLPAEIFNVNNLKR